MSAWLLVLGVWCGLVVFAGITAVVIESIARWMARRNRVEV